MMTNQQRCAEATRVAAERFRRETDHHGDATAIVREAYGGLSRGIFERDGDDGIHPERGVRVTDVDLRDELMRKRDEAAARGEPFDAIAAARELRG